MEEPLAQVQVIQGINSLRKTFRKWDSVYNGLRAESAPIYVVINAVHEYLSFTHCL